MTYKKFMFTMIIVVCLCWTEAYLMLYPIYHSILLALMIGVSSSDIARFLMRYYEDNKRKKDLRTLVKFI
jgi:hypothetical protein